MAPLTWREVAAPSFSGVSDSQRLAGQLLSNGFGALSSALGNLDTKNRDAASAQFLAGISRYTDTNSLNEALRSGAAFNGVDMSKVSPEAIRYATEQSGRLLNNNSQVIANDTNQFKLDSARRDDGQAQARLAAQPEAAKLLANVQTLAGSGDAAQVESARKLLSDNTQTLLNAGYRADAIPGLLDAARTTGTQGFGYKQDVLKDQKFWESQGITEQAQTIAHAQINANATPDVAIRAIQEDGSIKDPRVKAQAIQVIQAAADNKVFATVDPGQQLLASLGIQYNTPAPAAAPASNYSVLHGHDQAKGGRFEGVDISRQTIGQLVDFASSDGAYGKSQKAKLGYLATPMGAYQVVGSTLQKAAKEMGLSADTVFTPEVQDAVFSHLAIGRLSGPRTMTGKIENLRSEWEALKGVDEQTIASAVTAFENGDRSVLGNLVKGRESGGGGAAVSSSPVSNSPTSRAPGSVSQSATAPAPGISMQVGSNNQAAQLLAAAAPSLGSSSSQSSSETPRIPEREAANTAADNAARVLSSAAGDTPREPLPQNQRGEVPSDLTAQDMLLTSGAPGRTSRVVVPSDAAALAAAVQPTVQPAPASADVTVPQPAQAAQAQTTSPRSAQNDAQNLLDQSILDRVFNRNSALINEIVNNPNRNETPDQTAARLTSEGGLMPSGNRQAVLQAINETIAMSGGKLTPSAAGALVANNAESRDLTSALDWVLPGSWVNGDRFSTANENQASATRANMNGVAEDLKQLGMNVDGSIELSRGTSQIRNQRQSTVTAAQIPQIQALLLSASSEAANIQAAIDRGQDTPANRAALARNLAIIDQLSAILNQVGAEPTSPTTIYSGSGAGLPTN